MQLTSFTDLVPAPAGRFDGIERPYTPAEVARLRGSVPVEHSLAERGANRLWELLQSRGLCARARRGDRQPGDADGPRRASRRSISPAGRSPPTPTPPAPCIPTSRSIRPMPGPSSAAGSTARSQRADQIEHLGGRRQARLVRADRRRRRGRLRRAAELLRDHEGLYRGGRRRRPFRGPARLREEVRPSRRQGADPDPGA